MPYSLDIFDTPVNSGALIQLCREGGRIYLATVEASASGHVSPAYPYSAEAPRVYGEIATQEYRLAWIEWTAGVLGADTSEMEFRARQSRTGWQKEYESALRRYIRANYQRIGD